MRQLEWQDTFFMDIRRAVEILGCTWEEMNGYVDRGLVRLSPMPPHKHRRVVYTEDIRTITDKLEYERYGVPVLNLSPRVGVPNVLLHAPSVRSPKMVPVSIDPTKEFFVYILRLPNGNPFYVGKGTRNRPYEHISEAMRGECRCRKCQVIQLIRKMGKEVLITYEFETSKASEAYKRESELIASLYRTYQLTNRSGNHYYDRDLPTPKARVMMTGAEWSAHLDRMPLLTKQERQHRTDLWREDRIDYLEKQWRRRQWQSDEENARIRSELDELLARSGNVYQWTLPLTYEKKRRRD